MFIHRMCENTEMFLSADPEVLLNTLSLAGGWVFYAPCSADAVFFHHERTSLLVLTGLYVSYPIATVD